jgi:hypothetical protein
VKPFAATAVAAAIAASSGPALSLTIKAGVFATD